METQTESTPSSPGNPGSFSPDAQPNPSDAPITIRLSSTDDLGHAVVVRDRLIHPRVSILRQIVEIAGVAPSLDGVRTVGGGVAQQFVARSPFVTLPTPSVRKHAQGRDGDDHA